MWKTRSRVKFAKLCHARDLIAAWRQDYNHHRPYTSLDGLPSGRVLSDECEPVSDGTDDSPVIPRRDRAIPRERRRDFA